MSAMRIQVALRRGAFRLDAAIESDAPTLALLGRSGAGKSTLLAAIAGLERLDQGRIELGGSVLVDRARGIDLAPHRRGLGVAFQDARLLPHRTVLENLRYGAPRRRTRPAAEPDEAGVIDALELAPHLGKRVALLSGGERQRVGLGRALLSGPNALLLDEPFNALDDRLRNRAIDLVRAAAGAGPRPTILVTHRLDEALRIAERLALMDGGRSVGHGRYLDLVHDAATEPALGLGEMTSVIEGTVADEPDAADGRGMTVVVARGSGVRFAMSAIDRPRGAPVVIAVAARDVSLARTPPQRISIRNRLAGRVTRLSRHPDGVLVEVDVGGDRGPSLPLLADVSGGAIDELGLEPGTDVIALVKSQSIKIV